MGFFKKIFKGIKKVVKKIGKGIKKVFKKIGKFMDKIGIVGQIGLALILPGIGQMLSAGLQGLGGAMAGYSGFGSTVVNAAGKFIQGAVKVASRTSKFFSSVTDGVKSVIGETVGAAAKSLGVTPESFVGKGLNKIGIDVGSASWDGVWKKTQTAFTDAVAAGKNIFVPTVDPSTAAQFGAAQATQVQADLQTKIETGMTSPEIPAPSIDEASLLSPAPKPTGPVATVTSTTPTVLESVQAGSYTTDAMGNIVRKSSLTQQAAPITVGTPDVVNKTFGEQVTDFGKEAVALGKEKAMEAISDLPAQGVQAVGTKILTELGVVQEPEFTTTYNVASVPSIDMGSTTDIGYGLTTPSLQMYQNTYGLDFMNANPYGQTAQLYDVYGAAMKARGFAA